MPTVGMNLAPPNRSDARAQRTGLDSMVHSERPADLRVDYSVDSEVFARIWRFLTLTRQLLGTWSSTKTWESPSEFPQLDSNLSHRAPEPCLGCSSPSIPMVLTGPSISYGPRRLTCFADSIAKPDCQNRLPKSGAIVAGARIRLVCERRGWTWRPTIS